MGSSISKSAPPRRRPMVTSGIVKPRSSPWEEPPTTEIAIDLPSGRSSVATLELSDCSRRVAAKGRSWGATGSVTIVEDLTSGGIRSTTTLRTHPTTNLGHFTAFYPPVVELYLRVAMQASDAHD